MSEADLTWWAWFWDRVEYWAFLGVVITLAVEFIAHRAGAPYRAQLEHAKDLKIAELWRQTQEANARAAEANLALERFRAPRTFNDAQAAELRGGLLPFSGTAIDVFMYGDALEISRLNDALTHVFLSAGWHPRSWQSMTGSAVGVLVVTKDPSNSHLEQAANSLVTALNAAGIPSQRIPIPAGWEGWAIPGAFHGPPMDNMAPIRMIIGAKE